MSITYNHSPVFITGERIDLCALNSENSKLYAKWENDAIIRHYSRNIFPFIIEDLKQAIENPPLAKFKDKVHFEIYHIKDNKPIGFAELNEIKWIDQRADLGLLIGEKKYHRQTIATEAGRLIVNYGFIELNLFKITANMISRNIASWKLAEKIGMNREAVFKKHVYVDGEYLDLYQYCIFRKDWLKKRI
ncbi:MAG: GNAT family N-acetyltransferase [Candidatus Heimdallarchaeota archaeon]